MREEGIQYAQQSQQETWLNLSIGIKPLETFKRSHTVVLYLSPIPCSGKREVDNIALYDNV